MSDIYSRPAAERFYPKEAAWRDPEEERIVFTSKPVYVAFPIRTTEIQEKQLKEIRKRAGL